LSLLSKYFVNIFIESGLESLGKLYTWVEHLLHRDDLPALVVSSANRKNFAESTEAFKILFHWFYYLA